MRPARGTAALAAVVLLSASLAAQDSVIARARAAAEAGRRAEGIALLEQHLAALPADVDARLVYGLILSWDGKYDAARIALREVLAQAPDYLDARVALMNVEWWSGRLDEARELNRGVLARDPGNAQARLVQQRLEARTRPWSAGMSYVNDTFSGDEREPWHEVSLRFGRETPVGPFILRGSGAQRFGLSDQQVDLEFYPLFRAGTYAFVALGLASGDGLYPDHRSGFELYQVIGRGFEVSGGFRYLAFDEATTMYLGTLTKYVGNWMMTAKAQMADDQSGPAWSYHASARRYFGASGTSFVGAGYSHGFTREEPRGQGDLLRLDADTVRGQAEVELRDRARLSLHLSGSRQERAGGGLLWQTTAGTEFIVRF